MQKVQSEPSVGPTGGQQLAALLVATPLLGCNPLQPTAVHRAGRRDEGGRSLLISLQNHYKIPYKHLLAKLARKKPFATRCCERLYEVGDTGLEPVTPSLSSVTCSYAESPVSFDAVESYRLWFTLASSCKHSHAFARNTRIPARTRVIDRTVQTSDQAKRSYASTAETGLKRCAMPIPR